MGSPKSLNGISELESKLLGWYDSTSRDLPWRNSTEIYPVWVSEVMLQQTRVATAIPYYERWMRRFPSLESLSMAPDEELLSYWQGLGYYSRCLNLKRGVQFVLENGIPKDSFGWQKVPGIGVYTSAAIASICYAEPVGAVDGNVIRVFARLMALSLPKEAIRPKAQKWSNSSISNERPGDWNQALMELGAVICTPRNPKCCLCPLEARCKGKSSPNSYPKALKQKSLRVLKWTTAIYLHDGKVGLEPVSDQKWWKGMWRTPTWNADSAPDSVEGIELGTVIASVTNHKIELTVICQKSPIPEPLKAISINELGAVPIPAPYQRAIQLAIESVQHEATKSQ